MSSKSIGNACAALILLLFVPGLTRPAAAQTVTGTLQGTVADASGGVLPGVTVVIRHAETGAERTLVTNELGFYSAPYIPIGPYTVTVSLSGFGTIVREGIRVGLNDTRVVDVTLNPAAIAETVTVRGDSPPINKTSSEVKGSLTAEQIIDKPTLSAGNFLTLAETFTGFQENPTSGQNNPTASSGSSINFNNTGTRGATFQINGVNNDDSSENQNRQGAALSTIQEFMVLKNGYSAEFGRGDGAVVLVQTKSGTNQVNGDAYVYHQDNQLNARSYFAAPGSPKAKRQRSQYGFTLGMPIVPNRLFAFGNVDRTDLDGENNLSRDLILPSEISGPWLTRGNDTPANRAWIQSILNRFPSSLTPNDPGKNYRAWYGAQDIDYPDEDSSGRLDWNPDQQNSLVGRYQWTHQLRHTEDVITGENAEQDNEQQNLGITWTRVFGSRIVGEARYGLGVRSTNVDIAAGNDTPIVRFTDTPGSSTTIGSAGNFPIHRDQTDQQFVYNLTWQWASAHSLKTGTDVRRQQLDDLADNYSRGYWQFRSGSAYPCGGVTYSTPYAAFFDGCVYRYQKDYGPFFLENRMNEANVYAQDDWRIRDNLTLNLGLRYEYVDAPKEKEGRIDYIYGADTNNVEPRLGFAYVPKWDSGWLKTLSGGAGNISFRGGWGIYDGRIFQSIFSQGGANVRFNPPNALDRVLTNTLPNALNVSDPTLGYVFTPGVQTTRVSLTLPDKDLEMPSTTKWNVSVERVMPFDSSLRVTYTHNYNGKRLKYRYDNLPQSPLNGPITVVDHPFNAPTGTYPDLRGKQITAVAADARCAGTGYYGLAVTTACPNVVPIADYEISQRVSRTNERRPNPLYTNNLLISNDAESWYDGVEFEWVKRMSHGLQFQAAYTFSKSMDTTSEATYVGAGDSNLQGSNSKYAKGYSRFHVPHRFTFNGSYRLPFFENSTGLLRQALGGWHLSGVLKLASGTPFTITGSSLDFDFDGFSESRPVVLDPSVIGAHVDDPKTSQERLPKTAFRNMTFGDTIDDLVPRNSFYGDGLRTVDLALSKIFRMPWQGQTMSVRAELFNAFDWVQFNFPQTDFNNVSFGRITSGATSYSPRTFQLVMRYRY